MDDRGISPEERLEAGPKQERGATAHAQLQGRPFDPLRRRRPARAVRAHTAKPLAVHLMIEPVDAIIPEFAQAGADVFVAGSAIYGTPDFAETIRRFRAALGGRGPGQ